MTKTAAGSRIIAGLEDALAYTQGDKTRGRASVPNINLCVSERDGGGIRITSSNVPGLHIAGNDKDAVFRDLGVVLQELLHRNAGVDWVKD